MTNSTFEVRRTADISRADALKGLIAKYPGHDILSLKEVSEKQATADGDTITAKRWVAELQKSGEFVEPGVGEAAESDPDDPTPEAPPEDDDKEDVEIKVEGDEGGEEGGSEKDMLHELLGLVKELMGGGPGESAPHGELGPEGLPSAVPGDPGLSDLPAPIKPNDSMQGMQAAPNRAFAHMANRQTFFVEAHAPGQSLKSAVAELNVALMPTHRVARIKRKGPKIIAGVTRIPTGA